MTGCCRCVGLTGCCTILAAGVVALFVVPLLVREEDPWGWVAFDVSSWTWLHFAAVGVGLFVGAALISLLFTSSCHFLYRRIRDRGVSRLRDDKRPSPSSAPGCPGGNHQVAPNLPQGSLPLAWRAYIARHVEDLGWQLEWQGEAPTVAGVDPAGECARRGIRQGDVLVAINGQDVRGASRDELEALLKQRPLELDVQLKGQGAAGQARAGPAPSAAVVPPKSPRRGGPAKEEPSLGESQDENDEEITTEPPGHGDDDASEGRWAEAGVPSTAPEGARPGWHAPVKVGAAGNAARPAKRPHKRRPDPTAGISLEMCRAESDPGSELTVETTAPVAEAAEKPRKARQQRGWASSQAAAAEAAPSASPPSGGAAEEE